MFRTDQHVVHICDDVCGHGKSNTLRTHGLGVDGGVHADDLTSHIDQRTARVTWIDRSISLDEALENANRISYPVLVRPSYVLGGRAMALVYDDASLIEYMKEAVEYSQERPVLIDHFLEDAIECDVDALCDGDDVLIAGIMQHIEEAGIHSGDSSCVLPAVDIAPEVLDVIRTYTRKLALSLNVIGLVNRKVPCLLHEHKVALV